MVVRERRRIAALARTASSLDEKVQEAERAVTEKESAFRAYVDEQRLEAADMAQQQQQHILSLMNMVNELPSDNELSSPVRSAKARHAEKANSKLLLLANERIAVLESQLNETMLGRDAIQKHRDRENETRMQLEEKTRECEDLEQELSDLRSAMRHIRERVTVYNHRSVEDEDDDQRQLSKSVMDIVVKSLHPQLSSEDASSKRRRRSTALMDTPGFAMIRQTDLEQISDGDEVPDWADDIMKDLETIAKGEMPSSLLAAPDIIHAHADLENPSVFERLNDPHGFTGIQKQKKKRPKATMKHKSDAETLVSNGQRQRKMMSKQIASSLDKLDISREGSKTETNTRSFKDHSAARSVFDRLVSPSNLTGTQRQRFQETKGKRDIERVPDERKLDDKAKACSGHESDVVGAAERMLRDVLDDESDEHSGSKGKIVASNTAKSRSTRKREEYQGLDVFERLNKTTTEAYAVKQNLNIAEKMLDDLLEEPKDKQQEIEQPKVDYHHDRVEAYTRQDVFERLQKTTTRAFAVKQHGSFALDRSDSDSVSSDVASLVVRSLDAAMSPDSKIKGKTPVMDADRKRSDRPFDESSGGETSADDRRSTSPVATRLRPRRKGTVGIDVS